MATAEERKIFDRFAASLAKCPELLNLLINYKGCEEFIRAVRRAFYEAFYVP